MLHEGILSLLGHILQFRFVDRHVLASHRISSKFEAALAITDEIEDGETGYLSSPLSFVSALGKQRLAWSHFEKRPPQNQCSGTAAILRA